MEGKVIEAVGVAIINKDEHVLIAKRTADKPMPNKWEFPGGKLEEGENLEACGVREIKEELELDIIIDSYLGFEDIYYKSKDFRLHLYSAHLSDEEQEFSLNEHTDAHWISFEAFDHYDFPASKLSFVNTLKELLDSRNSLR